MTTKKSAGRAPVHEPVPAAPTPPDVDQDPKPADAGVAVPGPTPRHRHLEGLGYYVVYIPALIVATLGVFLFIAAVENWLLEDDE